MRLAHLHLPPNTPFTHVSHLQEILTTHLLAHKKTTPISAALPSKLLPPLDPTIITFSPNPVYTTGRRDLPPSNTHNKDKEDGSGRGKGGYGGRDNGLSLPPSLEPIRSILTGGNGNGGKGRAEYHPTLRGGQTTYHGPGQMVAYTILDLKRLGLSPRCHIRILENSVVDVLRRYNISGIITEDPGVWVPLPSSKTTGPGTGTKKITAVGVHLRRNISSYGIGFNVTEEPMWFFQQIVACGLEGREATSLEGLGVRGVSIREVADGFVETFRGRVNGDFACGSNGDRERIEGVYNISEEDILRHGS